MAGCSGALPVVIASSLVGSDIVSERGQGGAQLLSIVAMDIAAIRGNVVATNYRDLQGYS
ncbi:hypothetical protein MBOU_53450 [Mycobacterium bourgelatii]|uniref:Uncharacterized protein n=1 Tax=Mycobacterium bourgelatii TaxID=1273442 RepID=A0A7I9YXG9_MYCBU|nr:hypothetical protein MBOU_53450 [Mycobacterium bourgelatii]